MSTRPARRVIGLVVMLSVSCWLVLGTGAGARGKAGTVKVKLQEFAVKPKPKRVHAGTITFKVKNVGSLTHEFVVVRTDAGVLPTAADGSVDEDQVPESDALGELEDIESRHSKKLKLRDLDPGTYTLFCNVVETLEDGTVLVHYDEGMHVDFAVE